MNIYFFVLKVRAELLTLVWNLCNMNIGDKEYSLQIYQHLCDIVGSKDVVKTRRSTILAADTALSNTDHALISSGSKGEGLDLNGSDYDIMIVDKHVGVYESIHDMSSFSPSHGLTLLMDTNLTKPGYTKLKVCDISESYSSIYMECCEIFQMKSYISCNLFREFHLYEGYDMIIHYTLPLFHLFYDQKTLSRAKCFKFLISIFYL